MEQHAHRAQRVLALVSSVRLTKRIAARLDARIISDLIAEVKKELSIVAPIHCEMVLDSCLRRKDRVECGGSGRTLMNVHALDGSLIRVPIPDTRLSPLRRQGSRKHAKGNVFMCIRKTCLTGQLRACGALFGFRAWSCRNGGGGV